MTNSTIENGASGQRHDIRIAVIAVHGVADQAPKETARSVADLLLGVKQTPDGPVQYGQFVEAPLRIEVRRLEPLPEAEPERAVLFARPDLPPGRGEAGGPGTPHKDEEVASDAPGTTGVIVSKATRIEFCIGPGAHTHYFDETARRVGNAVDQLIALAAAGKGSYSNSYPVFF